MKLLLSLLLFMSFNTFAYSKCAILEVMKESGDRGEYFYEIIGDNGELLAKDNSKLDRLFTQYHLGTGWHTITAIRWPMSYFNRVNRKVRRYFKT